LARAQSFDHREREQEKLLAFNEKKQEKAKQTYDIANSLRTAHLRNAG